MHRSQKEQASARRVAANKAQTLGTPPTQPPGTRTGTPAIGAVKRGSRTGAASCLAGCAKNQRLMVCSEDGRGDRPRPPRIRWQGETCWLPSRGELFPGELLVWVLKAATTRFQTRAAAPPLSSRGPTALFVGVANGGGGLAAGPRHGHHRLCAGGRKQYYEACKQNENESKQGSSCLLNTSAFHPHTTAGTPAVADAACAGYPPKAQRTPNSTAVGTTLRTTNGVRPSSQPRPPPAPRPAPPSRLAITRVRRPTSG